MKLNEIDFDILSDKELIAVCLKYKLIKYEDISSYKRGDILKIIKKWVHQKLKVYGNKKTSVKSVAVNRRMSISGNLQKNQEPLKVKSYAWLGKKQNTTSKKYAWCFKIYR